MENLIGRKIKGFKCRDSNFSSKMEKYIGKAGFIESVLDNRVGVYFENSFYCYYPLDQIQPHLIPLEKQDEFFIGDKKMYSIEELKNNKNIIIEFKSLQDGDDLIRFTANKIKFIGHIKFYSLYYDTFVSIISGMTIITVDQIKELNIISKNEENGKSRELSNSSSKDEPRSNRGRVIVRCGGQQVTNAIRLEGDKQSNNTSKTRIVKNENIKGVRLK